MYTQEKVQTARLIGFVVGIAAVAVALAMKFLSQPSAQTAVLAVAAIVIGITVRVAVMVQPGTRFHSYWRLFVRGHQPQKNQIKL